MTEQMSLGQIQWLNWLQTTDICINRTGERIQIQYGYYRGEFEFEGEKVDGYIYKDDVHVFMEYLG